MAERRNYKERKGIPQKVLQGKQRYSVGRRESDELFRIKGVVRSLVGNSIRGKGYKKTSRSTNILGCTFEELQQHLRDSFEMRYGIPHNWVDTSLLHIDHIIPMATATTKEEAIKLNHYTNLQYLLAEDNLEKSDKLDWEKETSYENN